MSSRATILPGRHVINASLLGGNAALMGAFVTMAPGAPMTAALCLGASTILSFLKGYTTTAAIGGADMRTFLMLLKGRHPWFIQSQLTRDSIFSSRGNYRFECLFWICIGCGGLYARQPIVDYCRITYRS